MTSKTATNLGLLSQHALFLCCSVVNFLHNFYLKKTVKSL